MHGVDAVEFHTAWEELLGGFHSTVGAKPPSRPAQLLAARVFHDAEMMCAIGALYAYGRARRAPGVTAAPAPARRPEEDQGHSPSPLSTKQRENVPEMGSVTPLVVSVIATLL
jgi:hypothetical protein